MSLLRLISLLSLLQRHPHGDLDIRRIDSSKTGLSAVVIVVAPRDNKGFFAVDAPGNRGLVRDYWRPDYVFLLNGGYFTGEFAPVGLNRIGSKALSKRRSMLSGFVAIDSVGSLGLLKRDANLDKYPTVIQSGPYIVDPGGKIGIKSDRGDTARRTVIGRLKDGTILIAATGPVTLSGLARAMLAEFPTLERLLNLDGGPSTALKTSSIEISNYAPVRNYIGKRK